MTARADKRLKLPLLDGGVPQIDPPIPFVDQVSSTSSEIIAFREQKYPRRPDRHRGNQTHAHDAPEQPPSCLAQSYKTQHSKNDQTRRRAQVSAPATRQPNTQITNRGCVRNEQLAPRRPAAPTCDTHTENPGYLKKPGEMIWADEKAARPGSVINPLEK